MNPVKVAVIGAGNWGRNHIRTLSALPGAELVAVCDTDEACREELKVQFPGVNITGSLDEAVVAANAVVIATPGPSHAALAIDMINAGKAVLIEKPLALNVPDAQAIAAASEEAGVPALVGHLLLFHPAIEKLKELMNSGDLGDPLYLYSQRVNLGQIRPDENALWSFGPHDVSVALELLGEEPIAVTAQGKSYLQEGIEDVVFMVMEFGSGVIMNVQLSWLDPHKERRLTVVGSSKMAVFDDMAPREKLKIYDKGVNKPPEYKSFGESLSVREGDIFIPRIGNAEPLAAELKHFLAVACGEPNDRISVSAGVRVIRILEAASKSLKMSGGRVEIV